MAKDYYKILGVAQGASAKDIKKAYRKLATEYHPDKTKGDKSKEERFKEISEAYQVLGNEEKRKQYDALGSDWEHFQQSGSNFDEFMAMRNRYKQQSEGGQYYGGSAGGFEGSSDFSDIFESFFGGRQRRASGNRSGFPGADLSGDITISLQEAFSGTDRILDVDGSKIKMPIKPGAYDGLQLRARGKGGAGSGGHSGDLYVNVRIEPHPVYERRGNNLHMQAEVNLFDALLGGQVEIITLSGKVTIRLKEGTQNGKTVRLKGKGMPYYKEPGKYGDLFVTLNVRLPQHIGPEQKRIIKELQNSFKEKV